ncbi:MAG: hypothetical protein CVU13_11585 [Bacteroidetes bacterium HGW-Bacteroidetes-8]|nr:MAG: hypothetical protein CVU13_11585 [Bacteroidetes bacterium HGW-Bacteroidetes-8]
MFNICDSAFRNCSKLESVNIPDFIDYIGYYVFANC